MHANSSFVNFACTEPTTRKAVTFKDILARKLETVATSSVYSFPLDYYFCAVRRPPSNQVVQP